MTSSKPLSFRQLLDLLPNLSVMAEEEEIALSTIRAWHRRGNILREWWPQVIRHAKKVGVRQITHEALTKADELHALARKARRAAAADTPTVAARSPREAVAPHPERRSRH
jgi:hypothetical protein